MSASSAQPVPAKGKQSRFRTILMTIIGLIVAVVGYVYYAISSKATDCVAVADRGFRQIASDRIHRFLGKVKEDTAGCRGGPNAVQYRQTPWLDWGNYWGTGDNNSKAKLRAQDDLGVYGALTDIEYQRIELIKFNLLDNNRTYEQYVKGRDGVPGSALKVWPEMRLPKDHPNYKDVGGDGEQVCSGDLIRFRNVTGICNDVKNPAMGSVHALFSRMVSFDTTYPDLEKNDLAKNRHGGRLSLYQPDPQVISRKLLTRSQSNADKCRSGLGLQGDSKDANCDYQKADSFNVLAAFWIQFMTHDWFSHLEEGHNASNMIETGCRNLSPDDVKKLGCRPDDKVDQSYIADATNPGSFQNDGKTYLERAYKTTQNNSTAWWDTSQVYGYDQTSRQRVKRDPKDRARLQLLHDYLPLLQAGDPMNPAWAGQEATAFPDNWNIGMSFYHNLFAREHNAFVDAFRKQAAATPEDDS